MWKKILRRWKSSSNKAGISRCDFFAKVYYWSSKYAKHGFSVIMNGADCHVSKSEVLKQQIASVQVEQWKLGGKNF